MDRKMDWLENLGAGYQEPNEKLKLPLSIGEWCDKLSEYSNQMVVEQ